MDRRDFLALATVACAGLVTKGENVIASRQNGQTKKKALPAPETDGGMTLAHAISLRRTERRYKNISLDLPLLSGLCWAAWGVNRPDVNRRTIPTAMNQQQMLLYAACEDGVWRYDGREHSLHLVLDEDIRGYIDDSPLILLYAVPEDDPYGAMHVGSSYQNVGLLCAAKGLGNCVKIQYLHRVKGRIPLPEGYTVLITHSIGWPA